MNANYDKFPAILRDKLKNGEIKFPANTQFVYEPVIAFRGVDRSPEDFSSVTLNDMRSNAELKRTNVRGKTYDVDDPHYYGVSFFSNVDLVKQALKFPRKNKKIVKGYIFQEGGPKHFIEETNHTCWWLYQGVDVSHFEFVGDLI